MTWVVCLHRQSAGLCLLLPDALYTKADKTKPWKTSSSQSHQPSREKTTMKTENASCHARAGRRSHRGSGLGCTLKSKYVGVTADCTDTRTRCSAAPVVCQLLRQLP